MAANRCIMAFAALMAAGTGGAFAQQTDTASLEKRIANLEQRLAEKVSPAKTDAVDCDSATFCAIHDRQPDFFPSFITKNLEFHGYFRSGGGINSRGGRMESFRAPSIDNKYRLGNESDTYIESTFLQKNWNPEPDGVVINSQLRLAYGTQQNASFDTTNTVTVREAFAQMSNIDRSDPGMKVWAGERFYRLPQLDLNDFWWYDMSGYGGGLENKNIGIGLLDISYIGAASTDPAQETNTGRPDKHNLIAMLTDIKAPGGKLSAWVNGSYVNGGTLVAAPGTSYPSMLGMDAGLMHYTSSNGTSNQAGLQYGYGPGASLSAGANLPLASYAARAWRVRLTDMYNMKVTDSFSFQADSVLQYTYRGTNNDQNGNPSKGKAYWASFGIRPIYAFTQYLGIELEPGIDYVRDDYYGLDSYLFKGTAAFRIASGRDFNSRPEIRIFGTYAQWGNNFKGASSLGGNAFAGRTNGMTFGIQCETWW